jgi:hypothetical protein
MTETGARLAMTLYSGIPVLSLEGAWDERTGPLLAETVARLAKAGHVEIVLNLSRLLSDPLLERGCWEFLERQAAFVRSRCGCLDIVGTLAQVQAWTKRSMQSPARWATSEEEAICRIKGIPRAVSGLRLKARLETSVEKRQAA